MSTPSYYLGKSGKLQPVHIIEDFDLSYHRGTALVYIVRAGKKPGEPEVKDLKKARAHLDMAIAEAEKRAPEPETATTTIRVRYACSGGCGHIADTSEQLRRFCRGCDGKAIFLCSEVSEVPLGRFK